MNKAIATKTIVLIIVALLAIGVVVFTLTVPITPPAPTPSPSPSPSPTPPPTSPSPTPSPTPTSSPSPSPSPSPTPKGIVLRVITRHPYDILDVAKERFLKSELAKKYNIVDIKWLPIDPSQWIDTIRALATKPGREVDVAWGGGPTLFDMLIMEGLLVPITSEEVMKVLPDIPKEISGSSMMRVDKEGNILWIAAAIASFGFTINKQRLADYGLPTPNAWKDLASPDFAITLPTPSVGVADATKSTSNTRMYEIIVQAYGWVEGWKIITLMGANARIYDESGLVRDAAIRGDVAVGITIDFYGYTAQLQNPEQCEYRLPMDGTIVNGDPIALVYSSKHPEAAQAFIAWVLSPEGQTIWMHPNINRMPVNPKVFETPEGHERPDLKRAYDETLKAAVIKFSDELALSYEEALRWFFYATITRPHGKLQEVWKELALAYLTGKITEEQLNNLIDDLANPEKLKFKDPETGEELVFSEEVAKRINTKIIKDVNYRNALLNEWMVSAEERYENVLNELKALIGG